MTDLLLDALAAYRLTRLATADKLLTGPRDTIVARAYGRSDPCPPSPDSYPPYGIEPRPGQWSEYAMDDPRAPKVATLVTCRWCAGMWISLGVVAARRLCPRAWAPLAKALAFSAGAVLLAGIED